MRIDAHQHFWHYDPARYPWIGERMQVLKRDYLPCDLEPLLRASGVSGTIAVQAEQAVAETEWLLELADRHAFVRGVVGWVDLCAKDAGEALARLARRPKLVGIRHIVHDEPDDEFPKHLPRAVRLATEFPEQAFVLDHIAKPFIRDGTVEPWREDLRRLAALPNVSCKLSGLVTEARWDAWRPEDIRPYLDLVLEAFGAERLMIGSDWPVCTLAADYARTLGVVVDWSAALPAAAREGVLGGNALRVYGLGDSREPA
jgi:L-fucono-1,5-lactonase